MDAAAWSGRLAGLDDGMPVLGWARLQAAPPGRAPAAVLVPPGAPDGDLLGRIARSTVSAIVATEVGAWADVDRLAVALAVAEAEAGRPDGSIGIVALLAPAALLSPPPRRRPERLRALGLDPAPLPAAAAGAASGHVHLLAAALSVPVVALEEAEP